MSKKVTKGAIAEFVRNKLSTNEQWAKAALLKIYDFQTAEEQSVGDTCIYNGVGFTGADGEILSSLSSQFKTKGWLSPKQMVIVMKKMKKYTRQIIMISDMNKLVSMVQKSKV